MQETVLDSDGLRDCCGRKPVFQRVQFVHSTFWEISCSLNDHKHKTGLCHSEAMARWRWQNQKYRNPEKP